MPNRNKNEGGRQSRQDQGRQPNPQGGRNRQMEQQGGGSRQQGEDRDSDRSRTDNR